MARSEPEEAEAKADADAQDAPAEDADVQDAPAGDADAQDVRTGDAEAEDAEAPEQVGEELLAEGESALDRGESEIAFRVLQEATRVGVPDEVLHRLAAAYALAGRYLSRHDDVLEWIEEGLARAVGAEAQVKFLCARITVCRQIDVKRVLDLAEEALQAAHGVDDEESYACVLSHAAFAGYRAGDHRTATQYAERAMAHHFTSLAAQFDACRAQLFAACARGQLEASLASSQRAHDLAVELGRMADAANESNNLAETYLELGRPERAREHATRAADTARAAGHRHVEAFARVLTAIAAAEIGELDRALELLGAVESLSVNRIFAVDAAAAESFWLLERGAAGDATRARAVARDAIAIAERAGVSNRLTALWSQVARSHSRDGDFDSARAVLGQARKALDRTAPNNESLLALAFAEVLGVEDPQRRVALSTARSRILRSAAQREDPTSFCTKVRIHRRLLELSGGVPRDLPDAS
jgi:tetratricopeptide (TPR) repeat protein